MNPPGNRSSLLWAFATFAGWIAVMTLPNAFTHSGHQTIEASVSRDIAWPLIAAIALLFVITAVKHWKHACGFARPDWLLALRLHWLPLIYIAVFVTAALARGLPPTASLVYIVINCLLVGISEEWMFRGILLGQLQQKFSVRKALWISSVIFGSVHALNALVTGVLSDALEQSFTAFLTGMMFGALRVRTGSIIPVMIVHGLFDCSLMLMATGGSGESSSHPPSTAVSIAFPILLVLPNFLYALFLMRKIPDQPAHAQTHTR